MSATAGAVMRWAHYRDVRGRAKTGTSMLASNV